MISAVILESADVEGLPQSPGAIGFGMIVLGLVAAKCSPSCGFDARLRYPRRSLAITLTLLAFSPYITWRIVEDVRYTSSLNSWIADRYGVSVAQVHPAIFDAAAAHMLIHAHYYLATSSNVDPTRRQAFEQWAAGWLLPRVATATPEQAGWILTLGVKPRAVGPPLKRTWRIWPAVTGTPPAYLGEVRR